MLNIKCLIYIIQNKLFKIDAVGFFINFIIKIFRKHLSFVLHVVKVILITPGKIAAPSSLNAATVLTSRLRV